MKFKQARTFKANHGSVTGLYPFQGVLIPYESTLERDFIIKEGFSLNTQSISAQPVTIEFMQHGRAYPYTPDFFVAYKQPNAFGRTGMFVEVKPKSEWQEHYKQWSGKWVAMKTFANKLNCSFRIFDEDRIRDAGLDNINLLLRFKNTHIDTQILEQMVDIANRTHVITINNLAHSLEKSLSMCRPNTPNTNAEALRVIWYALANRILDCDIVNCDVMNKETKVWLVTKAK